MPSNHTTNYQLSQWAKSDQVKMEDFNADNAKLDAALKAEADTRAAAVNAINTALSGAVKLAAGSYTGDGAESRVIPLPFTPKAVYVCSEYGGAYLYVTGHSSYCGGLAVTDGPVSIGGYSVVEIVSGGFKVGSRTGSSWTIFTNQENDKFHYIALG